MVSCMYSSATGFFHLPIFTPFSTFSYKGQVKSHLLKLRDSQSASSGCPQLPPLLMSYQWVKEQAESQKVWTSRSPPKRPTSRAQGRLRMRDTAQTRLAHPARLTPALHVPPAGQASMWVCFTESQGRVTCKPNPLLPRL